MLRGKAKQSPSLHQRLLSVDPEQPLPPLVQGDSEQIEHLNDRLHHLIALALRAYVLSWYPRLSRDQSLLPQIYNDILRPLLVPVFHGIQSNPARLTRLIIIDLPTILELHITTFNDSKHSLELDVPQADLGDTYHARLPLLAVDRPDTNDDDRDSASIWEVSSVWLVTLSDAIIRSTLPMEELEVASERIFLRELLGRVILGSIARRISQPWFWWSLGLKILVSGRSVTSKHQRNGWLEWLVRFLLAISTFGKWVIASITFGVPLRAQDRGCVLPSLGVIRALIPDPKWTVRLFLACIDFIMTLFSPMVDRLAVRIVQNKLLNVPVAVWLTELLEDILFPLDGCPAPTPPDPTEEESRVLRLELEQRIAEVMPRFAMHYIPPPSQMLNPLSDADCNSHVVAMLYTATIAALMPQLVVNEHGTAEASIE